MEDSRIASKNLISSRDFAAGDIFMRFFIVLLLWACYNEIYKFRKKLKFGL